MRYIKTPVKIRPKDASLMVGGAVLCGPPPDGEFEARLRQMVEIAVVLNTHDDLIAQRDDLIATVASAQAMAASVERLMTVATKAFSVIEYAMELIDVRDECPLCGVRDAHHETCVYLVMRDVIEQAHGEAK